jgi:phosphoribosyl 1,2-cyclic phosphate phosphodiesterase
MTLTFTILGCGSSGGVPRIGGDWGQCDPQNPKNRRRRCSLLVEKTNAEGSTRVLIDTSPDMREQMLTAEVKSLDAVWYTHEHADHTHGIDELRAFYLRQRRCIPVWADAPTSNMLNTRFAYCFVTPAGSQYPPIAEQHLIEPGKNVEALGGGGAITAQPFSVHHGTIDALGFRFGNVAYTPDLNGVPESSLPALKHLDIWIVDALKRTHHPSHFSLTETLEWVAKLSPKRAIITNMHVDMDYAALCRELPDHIEPAYDGMRIDV